MSVKKQVDTWLMYEGNYAHINLTWWQKERKKIVSSENLSIKCAQTWFESLQFLSASTGQHSLVVKNRT